MRSNKAVESKAMASSAKSAKVMQSNLSRREAMQGTQSEVTQSNAKESCPKRIDAKQDRTNHITEHSKTKQQFRGKQMEEFKAKQCGAKESNAERTAMQSSVTRIQRIHGTAGRYKVEHHAAEQCKVVQSSAKQISSKECRAKQCKAQS